MGVGGQVGRRLQACVRAVAAEQIAPALAASWAPRERARSAWGAGGVVAVVAMPAAVVPGFAVLVALVLDVPQEARTSPSAATDSRAVIVVRVKVLPVASSRPAQ